MQNHVCPLEVVICLSMSTSIFLQIVTLGASGNSNDCFQTKNKCDRVGTKVFHMGL